MSAAVQRILFLYTELAPYFLACADRLVKDHGVEVHIVRRPVNREAPFAMRVPEGVQLHERSALTGKALIDLARDLKPAAVFCSGWVDKGYLAACRAMRRLGTPTIMCFDTAWVGDLRQEMAVLLARFWLPRTFSHAWVTANPQALYARKLGFRNSRIRKGAYSAAVDRFAPLFDRFKNAKAAAFPHRFLCVARYIATKGHQDLCDAFDALCREGRAGDWELWFAGTGDLYDQVTTSPSGANPRILHLGFVQPAETPAIIEQCGVFVLPSTFEPWGVVVHEYAAAGMPLVLSHRVGAAEMFLVEGENGQRFPAGDVAGLKKALQWIISRHDADLAHMGERSAAVARGWDPGRWAQVAMDFTLGRNA